MSDQQAHTPEPWRGFNGTDVFPDDDDTEGRHYIADFWPEQSDMCDIDFKEARANRDRAIACVNGCAGLNPAGIKGAVEALELIAAMYESDTQLSADEQLSRASDFAKHALAKLREDA